MIARRHLRAMGTDVTVLLDPDPDAYADVALEDACAEIVRIEQLASRFAPNSEISRLNRSGQLKVSGDTLALITAALRARQMSAGAFDPTVGAALCAAGYDRDFTLISEMPAPRSPAVPAGGHVHVHDDATVTLGAGTQLDLGGIAKGWTAERVADRLATAGSCLVNIGGDIAVRGAYEGGPWPVGLATPAGMRTCGLARGGLATSGTDRRRWRQAGREVHHLIDPATGLSADTDLMRVSVVASDATHAEVWATRLLLAGSRAARELAEDHALPALLVDTHARTTICAGIV